MPEIIPEGTLKKIIFCFSLEAVSTDFPSVVKLWVKEIFSFLTQITVSTKGSIEILFSNKELFWESLCYQSYL